MFQAIRHGDSWRLVMIEKVEVVNVPVINWIAVKNDNDSWRLERL